MRTIERIIEYTSRSDIIRFIPMADVHYGSALCDEERFKRDCKEVAEDPNTYCGYVGDMCEYISRKDKRHHKDIQLAEWLHGKDDIIQRQTDGFNEIVRPTRDSCLFAVLGNHDDYVSYSTDKDAYRDIIRNLSDVDEVEDSPIALGMEGFVVLRFRRVKKGGASSDTWTVVLYVHHGFGGGRLAGGHALALERTLNDHDCDIALIGHRHIIQFVPSTKTKPSAKADKTECRTQGAMFCGTYRDVLMDSTDADYATRMGLPYKKSRRVEFLFWPDKKKAQAVIDVL